MGRPRALVAVCEDGGLGLFALLHGRRRRIGRCGAVSRAPYANETKDIENNESSASDIRAFIQGHPDISEATRARLWVDWNYRLAAPWLCLIVILVGIPFGMQTGRRGMGVGILSALLIFFGYYVMMGVFLTWGKRQIISPALAGWLPALCFLALGLLMLRRCR